MTSVLIVDDQPTNRLLLSKLASSIASDIQVAAFGDPVCALSEGLRETPDLVISDYKMVYNERRRIHPSPARNRPLPRHPDHDAHRL